MKQVVMRNRKKMSPLVGMALFLLSLLLILITGPIGFVFGICYCLFKFGVQGLGAFCFKLALSIDQLGNVVMQYLFNLLLIKKTGYLFGNRDETISSVIGKNQAKRTLTQAGKFLNSVLDLFEKKHSLNSRDYHVEPEAPFEN